MAMSPRSDLAIYRRLLGQARPYWPHIGGILCLSLVSTPVALLNPVPLKIAVDSALGPHPLPAFLEVLLPDALPRSSAGALLVAIALLVALTLLSYARGFASALLETWTGERLVLAFRADLFQRVQRLSLTYHDRHGSTDSLYRIQYDAPAIQWVAVQGVIPFVTELCTVVGMAVVAARIDWQLAIVALLVAPVLFGVTELFRRRIRDEWSRVKALESATMSGVQEALSALRVVKAFGAEEREEERLVLGSEQSLRGRLRLAWMNGGFDGLIGLTTAAGTAAALFIGVRHVQAGVLTLGSLLLVMAYLAQLYTPLRTMSRKVADLQASLASAERVFALLDEELEVEQRAGARALARAAGAMAFQRVSFAYPNGPEVLHDVSFEVAPGDRVGIAGPTGAGKTTLVSLLMRFYDPTAGRILLDGADLRELRLADLRGQFSIVLQEPVLFSTSVAENIAYARPAAREDEIEAAAMLANAHDFVSRLPEGYATRVGERGMTLSGGERQRIALARAFLKDAPILILDEPTSSVDVRTEAAIVEAIELLMKGRTTFVIAHRPSTLRHCNVRLSVKEGRVAASASETLAERAAGGGDPGALRSPLDA